MTTEFGVEANEVIEAVLMSLQTLKSGDISDVIGELEVLRRDNLPEECDLTHAHMFALLVESELLMNAQRFDESRELLTWVSEWSIDRESLCQQVGLDCFALEICMSNQMSSELDRIQCRAGDALIKSLHLASQLRSGVLNGRPLPHPILNQDDLETCVDSVLHEWLMLGNTRTLDLSVFSNCKTRDVPESEEDSPWTFPESISGPISSWFRSEYWRLESDLELAPNWCAEVPYSYEARLLRTSTTYERVRLHILRSEFDEVKTSMTQFLQQVVTEIEAEHLMFYEFLASRYCNELSYLLMTAKFEDKEVRRELFWVAKFNLEFVRDLQEELTPISNEIALCSARTYELLGTAGDLIDDDESAEFNRRLCRWICAKIIDSDPKNDLASLMINGVSSQHPIVEDSDTSEERTIEVELTTKRKWRLTDSTNIEAMVSDFV
jgi:hypothetical protein